MRPLRLLLAAATAAMLAACAAPAPEGQLIADPYEGVNRASHSLNKAVDTVVLRPVAFAWKEGAPEILRHMLRTGTDTLAQPRFLVNHLLQGDVEAALRNVRRFGVNIVLGAGVFDSASAIGFERERADFGETLAVWGVAEGVYIELPLLGPATTRDAFGRFGDFWIDPFLFADGSPWTELGYGELGGVLVGGRADNFDAIDRVLYESADSYTATRDAYIQLRRRGIEGGPTERSVPDVFADE